MLEYFDTARLIGLTATPIPETMAFFNNNRVVNYTLEQSIIDGVNVDSRIYRIRTKVTEEGGAIMQGQKPKLRLDTLVKLNRKYKGNEDLYERRVKSKHHQPCPDKLILSTYRDAVYTEMFNDPQREPNMDYLPKTLIFALNENHATISFKLLKKFWTHG